MVYEGLAKSLAPTLGTPVQYTWSVGPQTLLLNEWLGASLKLTYLNSIHCIYCARSIRKAYGGGYCYPCLQTLARCDICIVKPELCHFHLGTCREPSWGEAHCLKPHILYLANTSGLKVGITKARNIPSRWLDQGATQAIPILRVNSRLDSGLIELKFARLIADKTNWRRMLQAPAVALTLSDEKDRLLNLCHQELKDSGLAFEILNEPAIDIQYPILEYPKVMKALNLIKTPELQGRLIGIKGQYLLFEEGVLNLRNLKGHHLRVELSQA